MDAEETIRLTVDGVAVEVPGGATVLDAANAAGVWIPTLCHREGLEPYGACRVCTVEVAQGGRTRLQAACALPAAAGMEVRTDTERVARGRRVVVELLMARAPGVPAVEELAERLGVREIRFPRHHEDCILCGLCVRACGEAMGAGAIGFSGRGIAKRVETPFGDPTEACQACGACTYLCPTGKMQMEAERAEGLRRLFGAERQCRYARMGFFASKICHNHFQCWRCDVDQSMEDALANHPALVSAPGRAGALVQVGPFRLAPLLFYHDAHVWAGDGGERARVGIDDFAAKVFGPVETLEGPDLGRTYEAGEPALTLRRGARALALPLPVAGTVVDVNPLLADDPALAGKSPFTRGWIADVAPVRLRPDLSRLRHRGRAVLWLERERDRLARALAEGGLEPGPGGALPLAALREPPADALFAALAAGFFGGAI